MSLSVSSLVFGDWLETSRKTYHITQTPPQNVKNLQL